MAIAFVTASVTETAFASAASFTLTLTAALTAGNTALVIIGTPSLSQPVTSVSGNNSGAYTSQVTNPTSTANVEIWAKTNVSADTSITVNLSAAGKSVVGLVEYSGVAGGFGHTATNSGSTANDSISVTTQDNNNFVVAGFNNKTTTLPTAGTGNLRGTPVATSGGSVSTNSSVGMVDNTAASPSSVTCSVTIAASTWVAAAVELRSVAGFDVSQLVIPGVSEMNAGGFIGKIYI